MRGRLARVVKGHLRLLPYTSKKGVTFVPPLLYMHGRGKGPSAKLPLSMAKRGSEAIESTRRCACSRSALAVATGYRIHSLP